MTLSVDEVLPAGEARGKSCVVSAAGAYPERFVVEPSGRVLVRLDACVQAGLGAIVLFRGPRLVDRVVEGRGGENWVDLGQLTQFCGWAPPELLDEGTSVARIQIRVPAGYFLDRPAV